MRPESLRKFDLFYLAAIGIGLASALLNYDAQMQAATRQFADTPYAGYAGAIVLSGGAISLVFNLILWFLASRMRMGWIKWAILVLVIYSVVTHVLGLSMNMLSVSITGLITVLLKAIAVSFLFRKDSANWYKGTFD